MTSRQATWKQAKKKTKKPKKRKEKIKIKEHSISISSYRILMQILNGLKDNGREYIYITRKIW